MTQAVQLRKGTTAEHTSFTGLQAEATVDTTKKTLVVHDGSTAGGIPLSREDLSNSNPSNLTSIAGADTASGDFFVVYDVSASAFKKITRAELNNAMEQDALASVAITGGTINGTTIGGTTAAAGSFTTLTASGNVTLSGGTANGVLYLNGSKVATSGSALTFDGADFSNGAGKVISGGDLRATITGTGNVGLNLVRSGGTAADWYNYIPSGSADLVWYKGSELMRLTSTGLKSSIAGTNADPVFSYTSDTNTGIFFPAADKLGFTAGGGTDQMVLTTTGLGIGTSSPQARLNILDASTLGDGTIWLGGATYYGTIKHDGAATGAMLYNIATASGSGHQWQVGGTTLLNLTQSGNLGLGVTPSAWYVASANARTLQINNAGFYADTGNSVFISSNYLFNTSGSELFIGNGYANRFLINSGQFRWLTSTTNNSSGANQPATMTQAMTLDASGRLLVNTTTATADKNGGVSPLQVRTNGTGKGILIQSVINNPNEYTYVGMQYDNGNTNNSAQVRFAIDGSDTYTRIAFLTEYAGTLAERARITSGGDFVVGKTDTSLTSAGASLEASGVVGMSTLATNVLYINRQNDDGSLVDFRQANTSEGNISVSGTTVSYNGGHLSRWSQLPDGSKDDNILKGTVMTNLDAMCEWVKDGQPLPNEQLNRMKVSDVEGDTNVAGVFVNWTRDEDCNTDDMNVAMTGDMIIRIAQGVVVHKGDLLMSAGDGTAKPQGDDIRRSKTVAKVTSTHVTCTYADGSYCVPCVLMAC